MPCMPPRSRRFAIALLLATLVVARSAHAAPDDYDPTFDGDGVLVDHGTAETTAVLIQDDGKIVAVVGDVVRYSDTGAVDTSFGTAGHATADFGTGGQLLTTALIAPDGKIVVAGNAVASPGTQLAIARFDDTGEGVYNPPYFIDLDTWSVLTRNEAMARPVCSAAPRGDCAAGGPRMSSLTLSRRAGKTPTLQWSWKKGTASGADFGDPPAAGSYALCVYDGTDALVGIAQVEGGGVCGGKPCWKTTGTSGWLYKDKRGVTYGVDQVKLRTGTGTAAFAFKGKHANVPVVPLPATLPLRVQLQTSAGRCFDATYGTATRNDVTGFAAKN